MSFRRRKLLCRCGLQVDGVRFSMRSAHTSSAAVFRQPGRPSGRETEPRRTNPTWSTRLGGIIALSCLIRRPITTHTVLYVSHRRSLPDGSRRIWPPPPGAPSAPTSTQTELPKNFAFRETADAGRQGARTAIRQHLDSRSSSPERGDHCRDTVPPMRSLAREPTPSI